MVVPEFIKNRIEIKFGKLVKYPKDCEALAVSISKDRGENISASTMKRLFGMIKIANHPRAYTLDIIAQYAGFKNWESAINGDLLNENACFESCEQIIIRNLQKGQLINLAYGSDRILKIEYLGKNEFKILESHNSKLLFGDTVTILRLEASFPMVCESVVRDGQNIGKFISEDKEGILNLSVEPMVC